MELTIRFNKDRVLDFENRSCATLVGKTGLYFIFLTHLAIPYPIRESKLIYIGMSESRSNSIGKRLKDHLSGRSENKGIFGYRARHRLRFTYLESAFLAHVFPARAIEQTEAYCLEDFLKEFGSYPICNNKGGSTNQETSTQEEVNVDWDFFGGNDDER